MSNPFADDGGCPHPIACLIAGRCLREDEDSNEKLETKAHATMQKMPLDCRSQSARYSARIFRRETPGIGAHDCR